MLTSGWAHANAERERIVEARRLRGVAGGRYCAAPDSRMQMTANVFPQHGHQSKALLAVFVVFAAIYFIARLGTPPVFDDTSSHLRWSEPGELPVPHTCPTLPDAAGTVFGRIHVSGYRPLSLLVSNYFGCRVANGTTAYPLWIVVVALLWGATAAVFFWLARKIAADAWIAGAVTVLFMATPPFLSASWVTWAGIQAIVPLLFTLGMGLYAAELEERHATWRTWALAAIFLVGPWFREFVGVLAFVILASEAWRWAQGRGDSARLAGLAALGAAHAMFPTALPFLAGFRDLAVVPLTDLGYLGNRVAAHRFLHEAAEVALLLVPPVFMVLTGIAFLLAKPRADSADGRWFKWLRWGACAAIVALLAGYFVTSHPVFQWFAVVLLALVPAIYALTRHAWLALWYAASFLPFLRLYIQETHLLYLAAPLALVAGIALQDLIAGARRVNSRVARLALLAAATIGVLDQAINIPATRAVMHRLSESTARVAQFLRRHVEPGAAVVVNAKLGLDIALYSRNHVKVYFSNQPDTGDRAVLSLAQFAQFITSAQRDVYLLSVDAPGKLPADRHKFVVLRSAEMRPVAQIDAMQVRHPVLDPLRLLIDSRRVSFLGPPDFLYDIYSGPALSGERLLREHYLVYTLFKVTGKTVSPSDHDGGRLPSLSPMEIGLRKAIWEARNQRPGSAIAQRPEYLGYTRTCDTAGCYAVKLGHDRGQRRTPREPQAGVLRWVLEESEETLTRMIDTLEGAADLARLPWLDAQ